MIKSNLKRVYSDFGKFLWSKKSYRFVIRDWQDTGNVQIARELINSLVLNKKIEPLEIGIPKNKRIVVLAPHPDDEVIGVGGTLLKAKEHNKCKVIYVTSGNDKEKECREKEAKEVCKEIGCEYSFLNAPIQYVDNQQEYVLKLAEEIKVFKPDIIFTTFFLDDHVDHVNTNKLLNAALNNNKLSSKTEIWSYQVYTAVLTNVVVDITDKEKEKRKVIKLYESQMKSRDWGNFSLGMNAWNSRYLKGRNTASFAESFFVLPVNEYKNLCVKFFK